MCASFSLRVIADLFACFITATPLADSTERGRIKYNRIDHTIASGLYHSSRRLRDVPSVILHSFIISSLSIHNPSSSSIISTRMPDASQRAFLVVFVLIPPFLLLLLLVLLVVATGAPASPSPSP